jgi:hypothetical protein
LGIVAANGRFKAGVEVVFHQLLVGRFYQADNRQILLHDVDAVFVFFQHFDDFVQQTSGLFKAD